jgi:hypothetical protein
MSKIQELEALVASLRAEVEVAKSDAAVHAENADRASRLYTGKVGRKEEAIALLMQHASLTTKKFATLLAGITPKNMQSVVCYLRADGWNIPKGDRYELHVNEMLLKYATDHKVPAMMQARIDEYNELIEVRQLLAERKAAKAA